MKHWFTRNSIHFGVVAVFIAICFIYFAPAWQGKTLVQQDVIQAQAMAREIMEFKEKDGKGPLWTNSMFSGMPSYQIWVSYPKNIGTHITGFFKNVFPNPIDTILFYLLGAYLLFSVLRVKPWIAALGAIAFTFSSYNFIYIEAGHASKAYAIAFFAPVIAGVWLTLRGNYLWGGALTALFLALEIRVNHIQMTYYLFIAMLILVGIEIYHAYKDKRLAQLGKAFGSIAVACIIALAVNAGLLWTTYEYSQESIRGTSNLSTETKAADVQGVDREYAYQWSQGVMENITFLIPDAYGGGSGPKLDGDSEVVKLLTSQGVPADQATAFARQLPTYWGDKPFTSGPWYFGAIVIFLFVLGLFIVKGRLKWWLLSATLLSIFLAFGRHLPFISDIFFDYFPLYNKFRAVESTLVLASLFIPILAVLALNEIANRYKEIPQLDKKVLYSFYIVGGLSLLVALLPSLFLNFRVANHQAMTQQMGQQLGDPAFAQSIMNALVDDRMSIARNDAFRSLIFVLIGAGLVWLWVKDKLKASIAVILLALAVLIDMWGVNRRYLNKDNFVEERLIKQQFQEREVDKLIARDTSNYRVLDLTIPTFNSASTSYYHNTIGGYHAAKLMRYQELIERQFNGAINQDVLDMLNTKYLIADDDKGSLRIQNRSSAAGNAWIVNRVTFVDSAEDEMRALDAFNPKDLAIVHSEFKSLIDSTKVGTSANSNIELVNYRPDHLVYEYSAPQAVLAVFSEVYYDKGWKAYVDGEEIPYFRANYVLRAAQLPGGNHTVEFKFEPRSYYMGENISLAASAILVLAFGFAVWRRRKENA
ncbi:YfhO family protein [Albibacterium profundi]|uniref:YfhO family protein n=1 Tax=Albibacterium profundi TaxID=3134906 RepID=A0ABV5CDV7_9SPHI